MNGIKLEHDGIKPDPDATTPSGSGFMDDEFFEDTGEMVLPPKDGPPADIWVTRIPEWLWEPLATAAEGDDNEEIVIGEIGVLPDAQTGRISQEKTMRLFLNDKWHEKTLMPRGYDLTPTPVTPSLNNAMEHTYVFTEKDLPGYKPQSFGRSRLYDNSAVQDPKAKIQKRSKYRKAIPKHTELKGKATREYVAHPLETSDYKQFYQQRTRRAIQGANKSTIILDTQTDHTNIAQAQQKFKNFIRTTVAPKRQDNKAARIPKNELIDLLHQCFDRYAYWPMKELKRQLRQPEAYLKETLQEIADLVKTGPFSSCWRRNDMFNKNAINQMQERPPEIEGDDGADEEDNEEMEDVV